MKTRTQSFLAALILILASMYVHNVLKASGSLPPREPFDRFPVRLGTWTGTNDASFPNDLLKNLGVDEYLMRTYSDGKDELWLYVGYYKAQREGAVPHSPRHCYPGSGWTPVKRGYVDIPASPGATSRFRSNWFVFAKGDARELVIYWYQSRGRSVASEYWDRYYLVRDEILRGRSDGALIRCSMRVNEGGEARALGKLRSFISELYPVLPRHVPG